MGSIRPGTSEKRLKTSFKKTPERIHIDVHLGHVKGTLLIIVVTVVIIIIMGYSLLTLTGLEGLISPSLVKGLKGHICPSVVTSSWHHCDVI